MKRLIFLKIAVDTLPEDLSISKFRKECLVLQDKAVKEFRSQMKNNKLFTITKDYLPEAKVLIEFPDEQLQVVYEYLITIELVSIIDPHVPREEQ